ncbi:MAG: tol-pal system protein YbgF, partial [Pseudomonadota bacterium]
APATNLSGDSVLERVDAIEAELQRLTRQTETLNQRIDRVVSDGTNRVGDLEFRLCELDSACDISNLPETRTLGDDGSGASSVTAVEPATPSIDESGELAVGEQAQFDTAAQALADGDPATAADLFAQFDTAYPGSPLAAQAHLGRGRALEQLGDTREAARAFLASFTGNSTGPAAAEALFELGAALGRLGQTEQACVTLGEVNTRFPGSPTVANADREMAALSCN